MQKLNLNSPELQTFHSQKHYKNFRIKNSQNIKEMSSHGEQNLKPVK